MNEKKLKKMLKDAAENKKLKVGTKEVQKSIKGTNLILTSDSLPVTTADKIRKLSEESNIPIIQYPGNSALLGRLCNLSYRVSVVSLKSISESELSSILSND